MSSYYELNKHKWKESRERREKRLETDPDYREVFLLKRRQYDKVKYERSKLNGKYEQKKADYKINNGSAYLFGIARRRAKKFNLDFTITKDDIIIPKLCPVLNIPLEFTPGEFNDNTPTLDRVDNQKGYIKGNVSVISNRANRMKSSLTIGDCLALIRYMETCPNE